MPGTERPISTAAEVHDFVRAEHGCPVIVKAAFGGGGRGMRKIERKEEVCALELCPHFAPVALRSTTRLSALHSEARAAFGDGSLFVEKFVEKPRHIEVQIMGE